MTFKTVAIVFVQEGCPFNKVAGLGFDGVPATETLDELESAFAARGATIRVEVSTLADPGVARTLTQRGYALVGFENVLGLELTPESVSALSSPPGSSSAFRDPRKEPPGSTW